MPSPLLQELILDLNTDVAEFCPGPPSHQQLLAIGTYQLDEASQQRHGRLHLYSLSGDSSDCGSQTHLTLAATLDCPAGIFDLQWTQLPSIHDTPCIGLALADGSMQLLAVTAASPATAGDTAAAATSPAPHQLQQLCSCQAVSDGMALFLDWNQQQQQQQQGQEVSTNLAAVSSSSGSITVIQVRFKSGQHSKTPTVNNTSCLAVRFSKALTTQHLSPLTSRQRDSKPPHHSQCRISPPLLPCVLHRLPQSVPLVCLLLLLLLPLSFPQLLACRLSPQDLLSCWSGRHMTWRHGWSAGTNTT